MAVDGYLNFDTKINTAGFKKGISSIDGALDTLKDQLKSIASAVGIVFGIRELIRFGKTAVETAAEVNAANSAMTQTFGTLEQAARDAMQRVAEESGIMQTRLQGVGTSIYAFAKASGMDSVRALSMMEDALRVAADSAAYYDRSLEETSESLRSFLKGNFANDAALGVSCTETTRNIAANKLYAKSYRELSEAQKQLVLLQMVKDANALSGAEGQAAREAEGWENVIGNLKEAWRQLMAAVGQPALHVATAAVQQLTAWLTALTEAAQTASAALSAVMGWEDDQTAATAAVSGNISQSVTEQNALTDAVKETAKEQDKTLSKYDELHKLSAPDASAGTGSSGMTAAVPAAVDAKPAEKEAKKLPARIQKLLKPIKLAWDANSPQLIKEAKGAADKLKKLFSSVGRSLESVWTNGSGERLFGNLIILAGDFLGVIGDIAGTLSAAWNDSGRGTALVQSYSDRWNSLLELIHAVTDAARTAWNSGSGEAILGDLLDILTDINNIWTNLRTQFTEAWQENDLGVRIFEHFFDIIQLITGAFRRMTSATAKWAKKLDFSQILTAFDELLAEIEPLVDTIGGALADAYENVLLPLGKWVIEKGAPAAIDLLSGAVRALTAVINAAKPAAKWLWNNFLQPIAKWTGGTIVFVLGVLGEALRNIADWINKHQSLVTGFFKLVGVAFLAAVAPILTAGAALVKHWDEIKQFAADMWAEIERVLWDFFDSVVSVYNKIVSFLQDCWDAIKEIFAGVGKFFGDAFTAAWDAVTTAFSAVGKWFSDRWQDIKNVFSAVGNWFGSIFSGAWKAIKDAFSAAASFFRGIWDSIKGVFKSVADWFGEKFQAAYNAITGIFDKIGGFFEGVWKGIKGVLNTVLGGIESMLNGIIHAANKIIGFLNSLSVDIPDWVPGVGGKSIGFHFEEKQEVKLPRLATGTVVPANFGEFAAILGDNRREPEVVSPLSTMKRAVLEALSEHSGNGGRTQTIIVQLMCDGRKLAEIVKKYNISNGRITNGGSTR